VTPPLTLRIFQEAAKNLQSLCAEEYTTQVEKAIQVLCQAFKAGNKVLVFGNGGSSADAQHICAELVGRFMRDRAALPAIALSSNEAVITAWSPLSLVKSKRLAGQVMWLGVYRRAGTLPTWLLLFERLAPRGFEPLV
jgi:hypothetical protein